MNSIDQTVDVEPQTKAEKLMWQLATYKPHSRVVPRADAVELWNHLKGTPAAAQFHFKRRSNSQTIVRWEVSNG